MKKTIFILLSMITIHANAQFSYSIKAGWSQPFFRNYSPEKVNSSLMFGTSIHYSINNFCGLQSELNYKRICYVDPYEGLGNFDNAFTNKAHYLDIPFLFTASTIPSPQYWRAIWNIGLFVDIPIKGYNSKQTNYGLMTALQIEILSHYFLRGEYQWGLMSDKKEEWFKDCRTNILSISLGYRF